MKTKEELNALKKEVETVNKKIPELTSEELSQMAGGEDKEQGAADRIWECIECGANGGPLSGEEVLEAIRNHMNSTGHTRIALL